MTRSSLVLTMSLAVLAIGGPSVVRYSPKLVWNASASVPIGLYTVSRPHTLHVGDIAVVTPPEPLATMLDARRSLPRGVPLIKPVAALAGQIVCRRGPVVTVDGVAFGMALARDHRGRPLPVWDGCRLLGPRDVFLMNPGAPDSFDGRYFGVLPLCAVIGRATPLWLPKGR
jgi:conjugative transfer signal peptidase TraF